MPLHVSSIQHRYQELPHLLYSSIYAFSIMSSRYSIKQGESKKVLARGNLLYNRPLTSVGVGSAALLLFFRRFRGRKMAPACVHRMPRVKFRKRPDSVTGSACVLPGLLNSSSEMSWSDGRAACMLLFRKRDSLYGVGTVSAAAAPLCNIPDFENVEEALTAPTKEDEMMPLMPICVWRQRFTWARMEERHACNRSDTLVGPSLEHFIPNHRDQPDFLGCPHQLLRTRFWSC